MSLSVRNISGALVQNILEALTGLFTIWVVTRVYPPAEAGGWMVFVTLAQVGAKMREGLVQTGMVQGVAKTGGDLPLGLARLSLQVSIGFEICIWALLLSLLPWVPNSISIWIPYYPLYGMAWMLLRWLSILMQSRLQVSGLMLQQALYLLGCLLAGLAVYLFHPQVQVFALLLAAAMVLGMLPAMLRLPLKELWKARSEKQDWLQIWSFGKYGLLRELTGTLSARAGLLLTAGMLTTGDAALYGIAQRYTQLILLPNAAIFSLVFPRACQLTKGRHSTPALYHLLGRTIGGLWSGYTLVLIAGAILGPMIIPFIHGAEYAPAVPLMLLMMGIAAFFTPLGNAFGALTNATHRPGLNTRIVLVNSGLQVAASWILIRYFGLYGGVLAPLLPETVGLFSMAYLWNFHYRKPHTPNLHDIGNRSHP